MSFAALDSAPHPEHGVFRYTAESHIAMALPILWVQGQKGQQINGGFEHIESFTAPSPVKAVSGIATFYITTVAFSLRIDTSFVGVTATPCSSVPTNTAL